MFKRFVCFLVCFSFLVGILAVYSFASYLPGDTVSPGGNVSIDITGLGDYLWNEMQLVTTGARNFLDYLFDDSVCLSGYSLNGRHNFVEQTTTVNGKFGTYYICEYCGESAGEVFQDAYDNYVSDLPFSSYNNTGTFLWYPTVNDISSDYPLTWNGVNVETTDFLSNIWLNNCHFGSDRSINCSLSRVGTDSFREVWNRFDCKFVAPYTGYYSRISTVATAVFLSGIDFEGYSFTEYWPVSSSSYYTSGDSISCSENFDFRASSLDYISFSWIFPVYSVMIPNPTFLMPDGNTYSGGDIYNVDSRPTSIQGDLAYYDVSGTLNLSPSTSIVNENYNSVYNPVTNTTTDVSGWTYDYTTRTYDLSTTSGDTITVTYGDENITISEGGDTYTVYYVTQNVIPDTPTPTDPPTPTTTPAPFHVHDYISTITTQPSCTTAGVETYTCTECGDSYTQYIPILGHDWVCIESDSAWYYDPDLEESVVVGSSRYMCQRCGEICVVTDSNEYPSPYPDHYDPSTDPPGRFHVHNYVRTVMTEPGCLTPGEAIYTCPSDGDTYIGSVPAVGHDWRVKKQVHTEYDNSGELIQQGYTIYKCSRCGEEYRSDDSVNPSPPTTPAPSDPPAGGGGDSSGGGDGGLTDYTSEKLSGFQRFWEIIVSYFTELPSMFEDVTSFMADAFPYIPEEIMYLIGFGVAMAVLVGIFKLVFR